MKKRALDALKAVGILLIVFLIINIVTNAADKYFVTIDGNVYNTSSPTLKLTLMTEEGIDELERFNRLTELKVTPYKAEILNSLNTNDPQLIASVRKEIDDVYGSCTDVEDVHFLNYLPKLRKLSIPYCSASDISPVSKMKSLEELDISFTNVEDISPLEGLSELKRLNITGIPCDNFKPLTGLSSLEYVMISAETDGETFDLLRKKGVKVEVYFPVNKN